MNDNPKITKIEDNKKSWSVCPELCKSCGLCKEVCPVKCIEWSKSDTGIYGAPSVTVDIEKCIACGMCQQICPDCAIKVEKKDS